MNSILWRVLFFSASLGCSGLLSAGAHAALPVEVYANLPEISLARISPDGQHVAMMQPVAGREGVTIYKAGAGGAPCVFAPSDVRVLRIRWASSRRVLVDVSYTKTLTWFGEHTPTEFGKEILINTECKDPKFVLGELEQVRETEGNTRFEGYPPNDSEHILVSSFGIGSTAQMNELYTGFELYKVDPETGHGELVYAGTHQGTNFAHATSQRWVGTTGVLLDESGVARIRYDTAHMQKDMSFTGGARDTTIFARLAGSDQWTEIYSYTAAENEQRGIVFAGFSPTNPNIAYVLSRNGGDHVAAYEFDLASKSFGRVVYQNPNVDVDSYFLEPYTRRVVGVSYTLLDGPHVNWLDQSWAQIGADLHATFENSEVAIVSASADRKKFTVYVDGPQDPGGNYYLYDAAKPEISKVGGLYPRVTPADAAQQRIISYKARDGLEIPAYITMPPGATGKNMPLVVMPHGGPALRDDPGFDWWAQFVATRGFVVLQPEFRGSDGFGKAFEEAGHHKWGLEMQNDVSDGVKYRHCYSLKVSL